MTARVGVITFPGTLDDVDAARARLDLSLTPEALTRWAQEKAEKQPKWITDDEAISLAVDALNGSSARPQEG